MAIMYSTIVFLTSIIYSAQGSLINFSSTPDGVKEGLTGTVTLRCSVEDTASSGSVVGRRDVTQTQANIADLSSIIIMQKQKEKDVASVSHANAASIIDGSTNTEATGSVVKSSLENGFLQVTIKNPTPNQTGEYQCEANAIGTHGHGVMLSTSIDLHLTQPTIADLVLHVRQIEKEAENGKIERNNLQSTVRQLEHDRDVLKKEVTDGKTQRTALQTNVAELLHTETGVIRCGRWTNWHGSSTFQGEATQSTDVYHSFQHTYASTPTVHLGMVELDAGDKGSRYFAELRSVSKSGFYVRCHVWNSSQIFKMGVSFVSVAKK